MTGVTKEVTNHCPGVYQGNKLPGDLLDWSSLPRGFEDFAHPWINRASRAGERLNWFEGLIYLWVTFNGWLGQVIKDESKSDRDWALVAAAARDQLLSAKYKALLSFRPGFRQRAKSFHSLWPIFKVRKLEELKISGWGASNSNEPRSAYRAKCFAKGITFQNYAPRCFIDHQSTPVSKGGGDPDAVPADWAHILGAIYQIRCNLFHGGKSFRASRDREFVRLAYELLWEVWGRSRHGRSRWQEEYKSYKFLPLEEELFKRNVQWRQWHDTYPELFDEDDIRVLESQAHQGHHFDEWYAAIRIYQDTGYKSLVEKYQFDNHPKKRKIIGQIGSKALQIAYEFIKNGFGGTYGPDLLVYDLDTSDWFFCEVKGPGDSLSDMQEAKFPELADLIQKPIRMVHLSEKR